MMIAGFYFSYNKNIIKDHYVVDINLTQFFCKF